MLSLNKFAFVTRKVFTDITRTRSICFCKHCCCDNFLSFVFHSFISFSPFIFSYFPVQVSSEAIDKAVELIKRGNELKAADTFVEGVVVHEELGFLLGFTYAMKLAQESKIGRASCRERV